MKFIREIYYFPMKCFFSFITDSQSMFFISNVFLKYNINGVHVPQLHISYIRDTTHTPHKNVVKLCRELHHIWWGKYRSVSIA